MKKLLIGIMSLAAFGLMINGLVAALSNLENPVISVLTAATIIIASILHEVCGEVKKLTKGN